MKQDNAYPLITSQDDIYWVDDEVHSSMPLCHAASSHVSSSTYRSRVL